MRARFLPLVAALAACSAPAAGDGDGGGTDATDRDAAPATMRVATVNLRCLLDDWAARRPLLVAELAAAAPDAIAFQEVCQADTGDDNLDELLADLEATTGATYDVARTITHRSWDMYDEGIALAARDGLAEVTELDLPPGAFARKALVARVGPLWIAGTHLSFGDRAATRRDQLGAIRDAVADRAPVLIAGDMNAAPDEPAIDDARAAGYTEAWLAANPDTAGYTFPASAPEVRIDHILVRGASVAGARVFLDVEADGVMPSDHLGVWADVDADR